MFQYFSETRMPKLIYSNETMMGLISPSAKDAVVTQNILEEWGGGGEGSFTTCLHRLLSATYDFNHPLRY